MMKGSVQWSGVQAWTEFHLQQDWNLGPCDSKSVVLTTGPPKHFFKAKHAFPSI